MSLWQRLRRRYLGDPDRPAGWEPPRDPEATVPGAHFILPTWPPFVAKRCPACRIKVGDQSGPPVRLSWAACPACGAVFGRPDGGELREVTLREFILLGSAQTRKQVTRRLLSAFRPQG